MGNAVYRMGLRWVDYDIEKKNLIVILQSKGRDGGYATRSA